MIELINNLQQNVFHESFFHKTPFIVRSAFSEHVGAQWDAPSFPREQMGKQRVILSQSPTGLFAVKGSAVIHREMYFLDAMKTIECRQAPEDFYYLQEASMDELLSNADTDLKIPIPDLLLSDDKVLQTNFWYGNAGCITQLHQDSIHNFFIQLKGVKEFVLFAPSDRAYLYPSDELQLAHESQIRLADPDLSRFPLFAHATPYKYRLGPGDLLYLPPKWWHEVRTIENSISINYWWHRFELVDGVQMECIPFDEMVEVVHSFLRMGYRPDHITLRGELLLIEAITRGYINVARALLHHGASLEWHSLLKPDESAYSLASMSGVLEQLLV
jgi:ribosomal protein L16 Arg81 hydroxylase